LWRGTRSATATWPCSACLAPSRAAGWMVGDHRGGLGAWLVYMHEGVVGDGGSYCKACSLCLCISCAPTYWPYTAGKLYRAPPCYPRTLLSGAAVVHVGTFVR
jgi:hypothetical protein